ncbi:MAG: hypothetical protein GY869_04495 [Planctomycetes bacterium]|nr:hypothetical protein [Planctomycetota bacterium]
MSQSNPKKRNRSKLIITIIIFTLLLLGVYAYKTIKIRQLQNKLQSYRNAGLPANAAELEKWHKYPPENQNAALVLVEAAGQYIEWDDFPLPGDPNVQIMYPLSIPDRNLAYHPLDDWAHKNWNLLPVLGDTYILPPGETLNQNTQLIVVDYLKDNADALITLRQILDLNQSRMPIDYSQGLSIEIPLFSSKIAAGTLLLESLLHLENQRPDLAVPNIVSTFKIARFCLQEFQIYLYFSGVANTETGIQNLEHTLNRYPLTKIQLNAIAAALSELKSTPGLSHTFIGYRCMISDDISSNRWDGTLSISEPKLEKKAPIFAFFGIVDSNHLLFLDLMDRSDAILQLPLEQRLTAAQAVEEQINRYADHHLLIDILRDFLPPVEMFIKRDLRFHALMHSAQTALAIERYRLDHSDQIPDSLTELVPDYLNAIPIDPYDGLSIKYKKTSSGYTIFTVYNNQPDNRNHRTFPIETYTPPTDEITFSVRRK